MKQKLEEYKTQYRKEFEKENIDIYELGRLSELITIIESYLINAKSNNIMNRIRSIECIYCENIIDDIQHVRLLYEINIHCKYCGHNERLTTCEEGEEK